MWPTLAQDRKGTDLLLGSVPLSFRAREKLERYAIGINQELERKPFVQSDVEGSGEGVPRLHGVSDYLSREHQGEPTPLGPPSAFISTLFSVREVTKKWVGIKLAPDVLVKVASIVKTPAGVRASSRL
jgi:hypothetical protein